MSALHPHPQLSVKPEDQLGEANQKYFDSAVSAGYLEKDWIRAGMLQIAAGLQSRVGWLGLASSSTADGGTHPRVRLLDYACGNGLVSETLHSFVAECRGIDVSAGMVRLYNENAAQLGLEPQKMRAVQGDLMEPSHPGVDADDIRDFDLAVMSMGLHHVPDPLAMLRALVGRLRPGGKVVIIDWTLEPDQDDNTDVVRPQLSTEYPIAYDGFNRQQMARLLKEAGCPVNDYQVNPEDSPTPSKANPLRHMFFAKGEVA